MPTAEESRRALVLVTTTAVNESLTLLSSSPTETRSVLLEALPALVGYYSEGSAALAADYYDDARDLAGASGRFTAEPVVDLRADKIATGAMWAAKALESDVPDLSLAGSRLAEVVQLETARPYRKTVTTNLQRDPAGVGWQRITHGGCTFCKMLAGRGAVYKQDTARFASHPHCGCSAAPVFDGQPGEEADVMQYAASQAKRTPQQQQALRDHLAKMEGKSPTVAGSSNATATRLPSGFAGMSRDQVQHQIKVVSGLKNSEYRTAQLARLRTRLAELP